MSESVEGISVIAEQLVPVPEGERYAEPTPTAEVEALPAVDIPAMAPETPAEPVPAVAAVPDEPVAAEPAPKPRKRAPRKKKTEAEAPAPASEEAFAAPAAVEAAPPAAVPLPIEQPVPSFASVEPADLEGASAEPALETPTETVETPAAEFQVVNQPPETPRRGWWRRLAGG